MFDPSHDDLAHRVEHLEARIERLERTISMFGIAADWLSDSESLRRTAGERPDLRATGSGPA